MNDSRALSAAASKRQRAGVLRELLKHKLRFRREDGLRRPEQRLTVLHLVSHAGCAVRAVVHAFARDCRAVAQGVCCGVEMGGRSGAGGVAFHLPADKKTSAISSKGLDVMLPQIHRG